MFEPFGSRALRGKDEVAVLSSLEAAFKFQMSVNGPPQPRSTGVPVSKPWKPAEPAKLQPFKPAQPAKIVMQKRKGVLDA